MKRDPPPVGVPAHIPNFDVYKGWRLPEVLDFICSLVWIYGFTSRFSGVGKTGDIKLLRGWYSSALVHRSPCHYNDLYWFTSNGDFEARPPQIHYKGKPHDRHQCFRCLSMLCASSFINITIILIWKPSFPVVNLANMVDPWVPKWPKNAGQTWLQANSGPWKASRGDFLWPRLTPFKNPSNQLARRVEHDQNYNNDER